MNKDIYNKKNITILYVEDDELIRDLFSRQLQRFIDKLFVASNGQEGLDIFKENQNEIDLIITDINMPEKNGLDMIADIREIKKDVFSIILSAYNPQDFYSRLSFIDIKNDYLSKPVKFDALLICIEQNIKKIDDNKKVQESQLLLEQYKLAIDNKAIMSKVNLNGVITYVNDNLIDAMKYDRDELIGKKWSVFKHPDNSKSFFKQLWSTIASGDIWHGVILNRDKNFNNKYFDTSIYPIRNRLGEIYEYLSIGCDITEQKEALEIAQNAEKAKSTFLANMSHEIRTPLNGIIGFLDILNHTKLDKNQKEHISVIKNSSQTLLSIINDILDFSKIEANQLEVEKIPCQLKKEIELSTQIFHIKAEEKGIKFEFSYDDRIPKCIISDPLRLKQIIINLSNNAIKFTKEGKVSICVKMLSIHTEEVVIQICVNDTGIGVPKDKQKTIFDPFSQTDSSVSREYGGTGLGLSITTQLVKLLGGTLSLDSVPNEGSSFCITLPLKICHESFEVVSHTKHNFSVIGKILVAEDNKTNQKLIGFLLKEKKLDFVIVENGYEAVEEYKRNNDYDLILMDVNMPIKDGLEATKDIRKYEEENNKKAITIIALTANALQGDREKFLSIGMDDYLTKPIDKNKLFDKIANFSYFEFDGFMEFDQEESSNNAIQYDKEDVANKMQLPVEFLDELLESFFSESQDEITSLQKATEINDFKEMANIAHSIKGASANLQLTEITNIAKDIETNAKDEKTYDYMHNAAQLNILINEYKKAIS